LGKITNSEFRVNLDLENLLLVCPPVQVMMLAHPLVIPVSQTMEGEEDQHDGGWYI
jgi:hypothetical protein